MHSIVNCSGRKTIVEMCWLKESEQICRCWMPSRRMYTIRWWRNRRHLLSRCSWWDGQNVRHFVDSGNNSLKISNCVGCCILWHCCHIVERRSNCTFRFEAANESSTVDKPTCTMTKNSATAKLMREFKILVWDECTMAHKLALEAFDWTMKDLRGNSRRFGGAMILLSGDFRQTLPVIPKSTAADELNVCLKCSFLWWHVKKLKYTTNMRVALQNDPSAAEFSRQLLALGNGQMFRLD